MERNSGDNLFLPEMYKKKLYVSYNSLKAISFVN